MPVEKKVKIVDELNEAFSKCTAGVLTDYRGLTTAELTDLRKKFREAGIEYRVVKNTLAQIAARNAGLGELPGVFVGPMAVAFGYDEISAPAKVLVEYIRTTKSIMEIKGGFLGESVLTAREVQSLATLPSKEILLSQVIAGMQSPVVSLVNVLAGPLRAFAGVLQARIQQLEG